MCVGRGSGGAALSGGSGGSGGAAVFLGGVTDVAPLFRVGVLRHGQATKSVLANWWIGRIWGGRATKSVLAFWGGGKIWACGQSPPVVGRFWGRVRVPGNTGNTLTSQQIDTTNFVTLLDIMTIVRF